jgi:hypothetical protein
MPTKAGTAVALIAAAALTIPAAPASAATVSDPLVEGLTSPLGLAIGSDGTIYVAEAFIGGLTSVDRRGKRTTVELPGFVSGVAADGKGTVSFTISGPQTGVGRLLPNGRVKFVRDTATLELAPDNPDSGVMYGFQDLDPECAAGFPPDQPASYPGDANPNPYAVAIMPDGSRVVADAGGNTLLRVTPNGSVSVLSILPPVEVTATPEIVEAFGLPPCTTGATYWFHPVPTDVELGPDGMLYVSSLAGGPEDAALIAAIGGTGGVFRVNPSTGAAQRLASGLAGAVDLAVAPDGTVYVAQLFGGKISRIVDSGPYPRAVVTVADVNEPAALEWHKGMLYATVDAFGSGSVVTITP